MSRDGQVMFVDDEEGVRASWERYFRERGLKTTTAPDGVTAIDRLSHHPVDVVVSDMRMPGKNGIELLEWVHERQPDTRFIMLTGYGNRRLEWKARELGAVEYLEKPVSPDVLAHAIDRALDPTWVQPPLSFVALKTKTEEDEPAVAEAARAAEPDQAMGITALQVVTAPFLGLAFVVFLPIIGIGAVAWMISKRIARVFARPA